MHIFPTFGLTRTTISMHTQHKPFIRYTHIHTPTCTCTHTHTHTHTLLLTNMTMISFSISPYLSPTFHLYLYIASAINLSFCFHLYLYLNLFSDQFFNSSVFNWATNSSSIPFKVEFLKSPLFSVRLRQLIPVLNCHYKKNALTL